MSVYTIDGPKYQLPANPAIRAHFDHQSGLQPDNPGRGHYSMAWISKASMCFDNCLMIEPAPNLRVCTIRLLHPMASSLFY